MPTAIATHCFEFERPENDPFRWIAWDRNNSNSPFGYGATEQEAISNLKGRTEQPPLEAR
jgi:hypothetical protein